MTTRRATSQGIDDPIDGQGASGEWGRHPGFSRLFAPGRLTVGLFLPLWPYDSDVVRMHGHGAILRTADRGGIAALWLRDVPLQTAADADVGQAFDPWTCAAWLAAGTETIAIALGSAIITLRHPIDVAKQAASIDRFSGGRLVLGVASGDRPAEFPAYGVDRAERAERFRASFTMIRSLLAGTPSDGPLGVVGDARVLPGPAAGAIPMLVTGSAGQDPAWIAAHGEGWLVYPGPTADADGPRALGEKIAAWRVAQHSGAFRPAVTNEWIDLVADPDHPPTPLRGGHVLRVGRHGLLGLLDRWRRAGINHAALGLQFCERPRAEVVAELVDEVVPHFPALAGAPRRPAVW